MQLTDQNKKYITYAAIGVSLIVAYRLIAPRLDAGTAYDPTGNGSNGALPPGYVFNVANIIEKLKDATIRRMGTDEDAVISALANLSSAQMGQIITAFGKAAYNTLTGNNSFLWWATPTLYSLPFILKSELSTKNYGILIKKFPSYF